MTTLQILGLASVLIGIVGHAHYLREVLARRTKPHAFSWFIWGTLTAIAFFAQIADNAGPGAWVIGATALFCLLVTVLAVFWGEKNITRSDWVTFLIGLSGIPLWLMTDNPLYAIIIVTLIDAIACWPTFRKSWHKPHEEASFNYLTATVKFLLSCIALENFTWITALYPVSLVFINAALFSMLIWRRRVLKSALPPAT